MGFGLVGLLVVICWFGFGGGFVFGCRALLDLPVDWFLFSLAYCLLDCVWFTGLLFGLRFGVGLFCWLFCFCFLF